MTNSNEPRKSPRANRIKVSYTLNPMTEMKLKEWAVDDYKSVSHMIDDVVAFAAKNGFRDG